MNAIDQSTPNVLFIILDAARADHFSCYGYKKNTTPCMDRISCKGALFHNNFSNGTNTSSSIPKIFFSRYFSLPIFQNDAWKWGIKVEHPDIIFREFDTQQILATDALSLHGYRTALFHNHPWFSKETYLVQKFDESFYFPLSKEHPTDREVISATISWLEKNKNQRFFIYCHIVSPHGPYPPKQEDSEFVINGDASVLKEMKKKIYIWGNDIRGELNPKELYCLQGLYDANLKHSDKWIGFLDDKLRQLGLTDNTLIIITSDHGENLGENNCFGHASPPWDSVIRVPLIMVYPPVIRAGTKVRGLTESIDIMPTIFDICRIKLPRNKKMDGASLFRYIENPKLGKKAVFTNNSIRTERYKYILNEGLLYDLRRDPEEKRNIAKEKPLIKRVVKTRYNLAMCLYRKRYENSKKETIPDLPFYFPIHNFKIVPEKVYEKRYNTGSNIAEALSAEPQLLNVHWYRFGLFCFPARGFLLPITLSAYLPNGTYHVYVLIQSFVNISSFPEHIGFRFRFLPQATFISPKYTNLIKGENEFTQSINSEVFYCYVDLGEATIRENKFSVEMAFSPQNKSRFVMRHLKFVPVGGHKRELPKVEFDKDELRRKLESLRALGYV